MVKECLPKLVLLEFQFTNNGLIPPSARRVSRDNKKLEKKRDEKQIVAGEHAAADAITVKPFVRQLFRLGYRISDLHFYLKDGNGTSDQNKRFVLVVAFSNGGAVICLTREDVKALGQLIDQDAWSHFHLYRNPNGVMSVHCLHRVPDGASKPEVGEFYFEDEQAEEEGYAYERI